MCMKSRWLFEAAFLAAAMMGLSAAGAAEKGSSPPLPAKKTETIQPSWQNDGISAPRHLASGITLPRNPPGLMLYDLQDPFGNGLNNIAQYGSADTGVRATVYLYAPPVPDGAVIVESGKKTIFRLYNGMKIESDEGATAGVRRMIFSSSSLGMVSALAVARRGPWMIKLRVSGSEYRRQETLAAFDALMKEIIPVPRESAVADWTLPASCTEPDNRSDAPIHQPTTVDIMLAGVVATMVEATDPKLRMPWPADNIGQYCVDTPAFIPLPNIALRGAPASNSAGRIRYLVFIGDAGAMLEIGQIDDLMENGRPLTYARLHLVDRISMLAFYNDWPSRNQLDSLIANLSESASKPFIAAQRDAPGKGMKILLNPRILPDIEKAPAK